MKWVSTCKYSETSVGFYDSLSNLNLSSGDARVNAPFFILLSLKTLAISSRPLKDLVRGVLSFLSSIISYAL